MFVSLFILFVICYQLTTERKNRRRTRTRATPWIMGSALYADNVLLHHQDTQATTGRCSATNLPAIETHATEETTTRRPTVFLNKGLEILPGLIYVKKKNRGVHVFMAMGIFNAEDADRIAPGIWGRVDLHTRARGRQMGREQATLHADMPHPGMTQRLLLFVRLRHALCSNPQVLGEIHRERTWFLYIHRVLMHVGHVHVYHLGILLGTHQRAQ
jgi:hypothetical protein